MRGYNELSARSLAYFLAEQKNQEAALCPHEPVVPLGGNALESLKLSKGKRRASARDRTATTNGHAIHREGNGHVVTPNAAALSPSRRRQSNPKSETGIQSNRDTLAHVEGVGRDTIPSTDVESTQQVSKTNQPPQQPPQQIAAVPQDAQGSISPPLKRDHNSFSQNLFNTLSLRLSEWFAPAIEEGRSPPTSKHEEPASQMSAPQDGISHRRPTYTQVDGQDETTTSLSARHRHSGPNGHVTTPLRASLSRSGTLNLSSTRSDNNSMSEKDREDGTDASNPRKITTTQAPSKSAQKPQRKQKEWNESLFVTTTDTSTDDEMLSERRLRSRSAATDLSGNEALVEHEQVNPKEHYPHTTGMVRPGNEQTVTELEVPSLSEINESVFWNMYSLAKASENTISQREISPFVRQSLFYCFKDPFRLARNFRHQTVDVKWFEDGRVDLHQTHDIKDKSPPSGLLCDFHPTTMRNIFVGIFGLNLVAGEVACSNGTRLPYDVFSDISFALNACLLPSSALRSPRSTSSSRSGDPGPSRVKAGRKESGSKVLYAVGTSTVVTEQYPQGLTDDHAASTCIIALYALSGYASTKGGVGNFNQPWLFNDSRADGFVAPPPRHHFYKPEMDYDTHELTDYGFSGLVLDDAKTYHVVDLGDAFDDPVAQILLSKTVAVIASRWTRWEILRAQNPKLEARSIMQIVLAYMARDAQQRVEHDDGGRNVERAGLLSRLTLCWLRMLMLRDWDGKAVINRAGTVGTIIRMLAAMYERRLTILLTPDDFWTPFFERRLDMEHMPFEWLQYRPNNKTLHLLQYSFLFPPHVIVAYFRAINFKYMSDRFEKATNLERAAKQFERLPHIQVAKPWLYSTGMTNSMRKYFVLDVSRDAPLTDAINSLWRRNKQDLLKPLKVYMGHGDGGEEGHDVGGVQQEFFRIVLGQAFDSAYGMFTVDEKTRMTWFQPEPCEPLYKFEMVGVLMSLAIYNAITLPVTFPLAFYRKLLGFKVKRLDHIVDGWPDLAKGMQTLLDWKDGDVGDVFTRSYAFSYEAFGKRVDVDMEMISRDSLWPLKRLRDFPISKGMLRAPGKGSGKTASFADQREGDPDLDDGFGREASRAWRHKDPSIETETAEEPLVPPFAPATPPETIVDAEAALVTNTNREKYVKDYIFWLTDKSVRPEYEAFASGFYTCLDRTALSIFTPEALKSVVEGIQEIDVDALFSVTVYDGWISSEHGGRALAWFWEIFRVWPAERHRQFLEFVTACDRLPVNGVEGLKFSIQRDGVDDRRLPTSSTCFGTLLLPDYSSKEILEERLEKAIQEGKGFGNV